MSWKQRANWLAQLGLPCGIAWSPGHCSIQGETEQPAVEPQAPAFTLCWERNNHSTRPVLDSGHLSHGAPTLVCATWEKNTVISLPHPSSASRYRKPGHPWMLLPPFCASLHLKQLRQAAIVFMLMLHTCWLVQPIICPTNKQDPWSFSETPLLTEVLHWNQQNNAGSQFYFPLYASLMPWRRAVWSSIYKVSPSGCQPQKHSIF